MIVNKEKFFCSKRMIHLSGIASKGESRVSCDNPNSCDSCKYKQIVKPSINQTQMKKELDEIADMVNPKRRLSSRSSEKEVVIKNGVRVIALSPY